MDDMIERIVLMTCDRNVACDMVNCVGSNIFVATYSLSLTLLSCRVPPGNIIVQNSMWQVHTYNMYIYTLAQYIQLYRVYLEQIYTAGIQAVLQRSNVVIYDDVINQTINNVDVGDGITLIVTLDQLENAIGFGV